MSDYSGGRTAETDSRWAGASGGFKYLMWAVLLGAAFYGLLFGVGLVAKPLGPFLDKFIHRGWTPYAAVLLAWWCIVCFFDKLRHVRQRRGLFSDAYLLPDGILDTDEDISERTRRVRELYLSTGERLLGPRIERLLDRYRATGNPREVGDLLREETDNDLAALHNSYALARVFLWAIPILGFIGTVVGVGDAVGGFAGFLQASQEIDQIKAALGGVTGGLSVAFDTTLVALLLSVAVMIFMSAVERMEQSQVRALEEYCDARLVRRLPVRPRGAEPAPAAGVAEFATALRDTVERFAPDSEFWKQREEQLVRAVAEWSRQAMDSANSRWEETLRTTQQGAARDSAQQAQALAQISRDAAALREALTGLAPQLQRVLESAREELTRTVSDQQAKISGAVQRQHDQVQQFVGALLRAGGRLEELAQLRIQLEQGLVKMAGSEGITAALAAERAAVTDLRDALKEMEPVLRRFSEKPIDVKVHLVAGPPSVAT